MDPLPSILIIVIYVTVVDWIIVQNIDLSSMWEDYASHHMSSVLATWQIGGHEAWAEVMCATSK